MKFFVDTPGDLDIVRGVLKGIQGMKMIKAAFAGVLVVGMTGAAQATETGKGIPGFQTRGAWFCKPEKKDWQDCGNGKSPNPRNVCGSVVSPERDCEIFMVRYCFVKGSK